MSIEIINKGQTKFIMNCNNCDCKFSYEADDIEISYAHLDPFIRCPDCGKMCEHSNRERPAWELNDKISYNNDNVDTTVTNNDINNPCLNCWFYRNVLKNNPGYVGDTPCDTCPYNQVTCVSNKNL